MADRAPFQKQSKQGPANFWIGLLVMLVFAGAGLIGSGWAIKRILLEKELYNKGVVTTGVVLEKEMINANTSARAEEGTAYELTYQFESDTGLINGESRISAGKFFSVKKGDPLQVRYLPDAPKKNLPDGSRLSKLFWIFTILGLLVGLGASVVVIGMIVLRMRTERKGAPFNE